MDVVTVSLVGVGTGAASAVLGWFGLGLSYERRIATLEAKIEGQKNEIVGALQEAAEARQEAKDAHARITSSLAAEALQREHAAETYREALREVEVRLEKGQHAIEQRVTGAIETLTRRFDGWMNALAQTAAHGPRGT